MDDEVKKNLTFLPMQNLTQVLNAALLKPTSAKKTKAPASRSRKKAPAGESLVPPAHRYAGYSESIYADVG